MTIGLGDALPAGTLHENTPGNHVDVRAFFASGKSILFGVPGAFTPGCHLTHLPGYINDHEALKAKGVDRVACISVNDAFVMAAWGEATGATGKVTMLADPQGTYVKSLGLDVDAAALGGTRSKRFALVIEDGRVTDLQVEPDGFGLSCSLSNELIDRL